jgi:hypothetical protein
MRAQASVDTSGQALDLQGAHDLSPARQCASMLTPAESRHQSGNARLAVRLLDQAAASQARRITILPAPGPATLTTISPDDIPGHIQLDEPITDDERPGQYL